MSDRQNWERRWHGLRAVLGAKWAVHILGALQGGASGFNELKREFDGMTATMLSRRLRELECHGFLTRSVAETRPPTTTYRLTEQGREAVSLLAAFDGLLSVADCASEACVTPEDQPCVTVADCGDSEEKRRDREADRENEDGEIPSRKP